MKFPFVIYFFQIFAVTKCFLKAKIYKKNNFTIYGKKLKLIAWNEYIITEDESRGAYK